MTKSPDDPAWRVPVRWQEIPDTGRHFDLDADERLRSAIAQVAGLATLPRLSAAFDVTRHGRDGLHVVGQVSATVGQVCIVTLEPVENELEEAVDLVFVPGAAGEPAKVTDPEGTEVPPDDG